MMTPHVRACVVAVVATLKNKSVPALAFSFAESKHFLLSGTVTDSQIALFESTAGSHFTGSKSGSSSPMFDTVTRSHVEINLNQSGYSGFDFGASSHFTGEVNGTAQV